MEELLLNLVAITYFTIVYFLPNLLGGSRNSNCHMDVAFANAMFGWVVLGVNAITSVIFCLVFKIKKRQMASKPSQVFKEYVEKAVKVTESVKIIIITVGFSIFFFWSQIALWPKNSQSCLNGYNSLDRINWYALLVLTISPAIQIALIIFCGVFCLPCIVYTEWQEQVYE